MSSFHVAEELKKLKISFYDYAPEEGPYGLRSLSKENVALLQDLFLRIHDPQKIMCQGLKIPIANQGKQFRDIKIIEIGPNASIKEKRHLLDRMLLSKEIEDKISLWECSYRVAYWFRDKVFWKQLQQCTSEENVFKWESEWQKHALYAHYPPSILWQITFVLKAIDKFAEDAEKEAQASISLTSEVFYKVSEALYRYLGKTEVEKKRILSKRKAFIHNYLEYLKTLREDINEQKQSVAASMYARLLLAHEKKSLTDGNIVAHSLEQILTTAEIPLIQVNDQAHNAIRLKDRFIDVTAGWRTALNPESPCAERLKRKCFNKFILHILEEKLKVDIDILCAPLDPNNSQTGICTNFGLVHLHKNVLLEGWAHKRRDIALAVVPVVGKESLLPDVKNRTCYIGPRPYSLVKYNLAKGMLFTNINRPKKNRPSLATDFKECASFLMGVLNDLAVIENHGQFIVDKYAEKVHKAWKEVIQEQIHHLIIYGLFLVRELQEQLKSDKKLSENEKPELLAAIVHLIQFCQSTQLKIPEEQTKIFDSLCELKRDLIAWLSSLLIKSEGTQGIEICLRFLKEVQKIRYVDVKEKENVPILKEATDLTEANEELIDRLMEYLLGLKYPKTKGELDKAILGLVVEEASLAEFTMRCIRLISTHSNDAILPFLESCDEALKSHFVEDWDSHRLAAWAKNRLLLISTFKLPHCSPEKIMECENGIKAIQSAFPAEESEKKLEEIASQFLSSYSGEHNTYHALINLIPIEHIQVTYFSKRLDFLLQRIDHQLYLELSYFENLRSLSQKAKESFDAILARFFLNFDGLSQGLSAQEKNTLHAFLLPESRENLYETLDRFCFSVIFAWLQHRDLKYLDYQKMIRSLSEIERDFVQMNQEEKSNYIKKEVPKSKLFQQFWFLNKFLRGERINLADFQAMAAYLHQLHPHFPATQSSRQQLSKLMDRLCQEEWSRFASSLVTTLFPAACRQRYAAHQFFWMLQDSTFADRHRDFVVSLSIEPLGENKLFERFGDYTFEVLEKTLQWINLPTQNNSALKLVGIIANVVKVQTGIGQTYANFQHQNLDKTFSGEKESETISKGRMNLSEIVARYEEINKLVESKKAIERALQNNNFTEIYPILSMGLLETLEADSKSIHRKIRYLQLYVIEPLEAYLKGQILEFSEELVSRGIDLNCRIAAKEACRKQGKPSAALEEEIEDLKGQREALEKNKGNCVSLATFKKEVLQEISNEPQSENAFCRWDKKVKLVDARRGLLANLEFMVEHIERIVDQHINLMNHLKYYPRDWLANFDEVGFKSVWIGFSLEKQRKVRSALMQIPVDLCDPIENKANQLILRLLQLTFEERQTKECEDLLRDLNRSIVLKTSEVQFKQQFNSWETELYKILAPFKPGKYHIISQRFERAQLDPEIEKQLYDKAGNLIDPNLSELPKGQRHYTKKLEVPKNDRLPFRMDGDTIVPPLINATVFYKLRPESPGLELAVRLLGRYCFDPTLPEAEVIKIPSSIGAAYSKAYPALISQTVFGRSLFDLLINEKNARLKLERKSFDRNFLMSLLKRPLDEKPENFIAQSVSIEGEIFFTLTCPDNEQCFLPPFYIERIEEKNSSEDAGSSRERVRLGIKTILYCFDEMNEPMDNEVLDEVFLKIGDDSHEDPETKKEVIDQYSDDKILQILTNWTLAFSKISDRLAEMFTEEERLDFATLDPPIELLPQMEETLIPTLHSTLSKIYFFINEKRKKQLPVFPIELLSYIYPELAAEYRKHLNKTNLNPFERFKQCTESEYDLLSLEEGERQCHFGTSTNARTVTQARFTNLEDLKCWRESPKVNVKKALNHAITVCSQNKKLEIIKQELIDGNKENFDALAEDLSKEKVILGISFKDLPLRNSRGMGRKEIEIFILDAMVGTAYQILDFSHCQELTCERLLAILKNSPNLKRLNVSHCQQLELHEASRFPQFVRKEFSHFNTIATYCRYLEGLNLSGITNLEKIEPETEFKELRVLNASFCKNLKSVTLNAPSLTHFWSKECENLQAIRLTTSRLQRLDIEKCSSLSYLSITDTLLPIAASEPEPLVSLRYFTINVQASHICHLTKLTLSENSHTHHSFYHQFPFLLSLPLDGFHREFVDELGGFLQKQLDIRSLKATKRRKLAEILQNTLYEYRKKGENLFKFIRDPIFKDLAINALQLAQNEGWKCNQPLIKQLIQTTKDKNNSVETTAFLWELLLQLNKRGWKITFPTQIELLQMIRSSPTLQRVGAQVYHAALESGGQKPQKEIELVTQGLIEETVSFSSQLKQKEENKDETTLPSMSILQQLDALDSEDPSNRLEAIEKFYVMLLAKKIDPKPEVIQKLCQRLNDSDVFVRKATLQAVRLLVQFTKNRKVRFCLLHGLGYESRNEKRSVLERIGGKEEAKEFGFLLGAFKLENPILEQPIWQLIFEIIVQWPEERIHLINQLQKESALIIKEDGQKAFWKAIKEIFSKMAITSIQIKTLVQAFNTENRLLKIVALKTICYFIEKDDIDIPPEFSKFFPLFLKQEDIFIKGLAYEAFNHALKKGQAFVSSQMDIEFMQSALNEPYDFIRKQANKHLRYILERGWEPLPDLVEKLRLSVNYSYTSESQCPMDNDKAHIYVFLLRCNGYQLFFDLIAKEALSNSWERGFIEQEAVLALKKCKCALTDLIAGPNGIWFTEIIKKTIREGWKPSQEIIEEIVSHCIHKVDLRENFETILAELWFQGSLPENIPMRLNKLCENKEGQPSIKQTVLNIYSSLLMILKRGCYIPPMLEERLKASLKDSDNEISKEAFKTLTQLLSRKNLFTELKLQFETLFDQSSNEVEIDGFELIPQLSPIGRRKFEKKNERSFKKRLAKQLSSNKEKKQPIANTSQTFNFFKLDEYFDFNNGICPGSFKNEWGEECFPRETYGYGACALHATVGRKYDGIYRWKENDKEARRAFANELKNALDKREKDILDAFQEFLVSLVETKSAELGMNKKLLINSEEIKGLIEHHCGFIEATEKKMREWNLIRIENLIAISDKLRKKSTQWKELLFTFLDIDNLEYSDIEWRKKCSDRLGSLTQFFKKHPEVSQIVKEKYTELKGCREQLALLKDEIKVARKKLCQNENLKKAYLNAILNDNYWFVTDEIKIMAFLHNLSVEIYAAFNDEIYKANTFNNHGLKRRVIFQTHSSSGRGHHFWHCKVK